MAEGIVLADTCRTVIGSMRGAPSMVPTQEPEATVVEETLSRTNVKLEQMDLVYMGCMLQTGLGWNATRQLFTQAGIPVEAPTVTINVVYGSGLNCINLATQMIGSGGTGTMVAGDIENMSIAPYLPRDARYSYRVDNGMMVGNMMRDALQNALNNYHMGVTVKDIVERWGLTRQELGEFATANQREARTAVESGQLEDEIVPVEVKKKRETIQFGTDKGPRPRTTAEGTTELRPAFKKDRIATAASASSTNDGATTVVVMNEEKAKELGIKPMAYWRTGAPTEMAPEIVGIGPVTTIKRALAEIGMRTEDFDLIRTDEAFITQSLAVSRELSFATPKVDMNGGTIMLGHPVRVSGCRILVILLCEMNKRDAEEGLAILCIGGGMGYATIIGRE